MMLVSCGKKDDNLSPLVIETKNGTVTYKVEKAATKEEMAKGLMDRKELKADSGMIFNVGGVKEVAMWMKDTYIPLDIMFINARGHIVWIQKKGSTSHPEA